ncbi:hypothetical protein HDN1F_09020 [gamma proteobacterium HdN1]|nr:hypothetical protein HDN1F_09020 [gamma proteobacterium HdN1]
MATSGFLCGSFFLGGLLSVVVGIAAPQIAASEEVTPEPSMEAMVAPLAASGKRATPVEVQHQWQNLLGQVLPLASAQIEKTGSFYPFAAVQYQEGQIKVVSARENRETLSPRTALSLLRKEISALATSGRLQSVVYLVDASVRRSDSGLPQSGIRIQLDHASGESMQGILPYRKGSSGILFLTPEYRPSKNVTFQ